MYMKKQARDLRIQNNENLTTKTTTNDAVFVYKIDYFLKYYDVLNDLRDGLKKM